MPYDLTCLKSYLEDATPAEIARLLDDLLYEMVLLAEYQQNYEKLSDRYFDLLLLRNQFAMMDENLRAVWK